MKMHYLGGKNVCGGKTAKFFLFFFLTCSFIFPQKLIDANNFPLFDYEKFNTTFGNKKIAVFNIDDIPPYDLIFYGSDKNEFTYHSFSKLKTPKRKFFFFPIDDIQLIKNSRKNDERYYIFISRSKNIVGLSSFTNFGTLRLLNKKTLLAYPSKILVGNFLGSPKKRALIFGENSMGVSLFSVNNFILNEEKVITQGIYSEGALFDMDADGMNDLLLYNPIEKKTEYYLNLLNMFEITFFENFGSKIQNIKTFELDGDKLIDYTYVRNNKIIVNLIRPAKKRKKEVPIIAPNCKDYYFSDFTFDYKKDLLYFNSAGKMFYAIRKNKEKFYPTLFLTKIPNPAAIASVWNEDRREIIVLSQSGFFEKYSPIKKIENSVSLFLNDFNGKSKPKIESKGGKTYLYWTSSTLPLIYYVIISSKGNLIKRTVPLPFSTENYFYINNNFYSLDKSDTSFVVHNLNSFGDEVFELPNNKYKFSKGFFINPRDSIIYSLPDTINVGFRFAELISANKNGFIFASDSNIIFSKKITQDSIAALTKLRKLKDANIFYVSNKNGNEIAFVKKYKITFVSNDTLKSFGTNYNFYPKKKLAFYFTDDNRYFIYDEEDGNLYYSGKINKKYMLFRKILRNKKILNATLIEINDNKYLIGYNRKLKTIDFIKL